MSVLLCSVIAALAIGSFSCGNGCDECGEEGAEGCSDDRIGMEVCRADEDGCLVWEPAGDCFGPSCVVSNGHAYCNEEY